MSRLTYVAAVNAALHSAMQSDPRVIVLGQDVGLQGGVFRATAGLQKAFGRERVVDTPVIESGLIGVGIGLCISGMRPVCEIQFDAFSYPALNQIITHVGRYRWRTGGTVTLPLVIRMPTGGGVKTPELHSESPESYFCHTPGIKVVMPATPTDAKGLVLAAIADPDPVVVLEPKQLYRMLEEEVPDGDPGVPIGPVRTVREGKDVTLIAWGAMVEVAKATAENLAQRGVSCHVCDLRTLSPLDEEGIAAAAAVSGRVVVIQEAPRMCSVSSEVVAVIVNRAFHRLKAPIERVTGYDVPYPLPQVEKLYRPDVDRVIAAVKRVIRSAK